MRSKHSKISSLRSLGHVDNDREEGIEQAYSAVSHAAVPVQYATYGDTSSDKGTANGVGQLSGVQQQTAAIRSATTMSPEGVQKTTSSPLQAKLETAHMQPNNVTQFQYNVATRHAAVPLQMKSEPSSKTGINNQAMYPNTTISATTPKKNMAVERPLDYLIFSNNSYASSPQIKLPSKDWQVLSGVGENTGYQNSVFINSKTKEIVIAHRGTDFGTETFKDFVMTDLRMFFVKTGQQKNAEDVTELTMRGYGKEYKIKHTGHSLGGYLAGEMALKYGQEAVTFDSPGIHKSHNLDEAAKSIQNFRSPNNIVNSIIAAVNWFVDDVVKLLPGGSLLALFHDMDLGKANPNTKLINPDGKGNPFGLKTHSIYDYFKEYFDPVSGKPFIELYPKDSPQYKKVFKEIKDVLKQNELIAKNLQEIQDLEDLLKKLIKTKGTAQWKLPTFNVPSYEQLYNINYNRLKEAKVKQEDLRRNLAIEKTQIDQYNQK